MSEIEFLGGEIVGRAQALSLADAAVVATLPMWPSHFAGQRLLVVAPPSGAVDGWFSGADVLVPDVAAAETLTTRSDVGLVHCGDPRRLDTTYDMVIGCADPMALASPDAPAGTGVELVAALRAIAPRGWIQWVAGPRLGGSLSGAAQAAILLQDSSFTGQAALRTPIDLIDPDSTARRFGVVEIGETLIVADGLLDPTRRNLYRAVARPAHWPALWDDTDVLAAFLTGTWLVRGVSGAPGIIRANEDGVARIDVSPADRGLVDIRDAADQAWRTGDRDALRGLVALVAQHRSGAVPMLRDGDQLVFRRWSTSSMGVVSAVAALAHTSGPDLVLGADASDVDRRALLGQLLGDAVATEPEATQLAAAVTHTHVEPPVEPTWASAIGQRAGMAAREQEIWAMRRRVTELESLVAKHVSELDDARASIARLKANPAQRAINKFRPGRG